MANIITNYDDFLAYQSYESLFWIIEYRASDEAHRYSIMRNECLQHPIDFKDRLNNGVYRIWKDIPQEIPW